MVYLIIQGNRHFPMGRFLLLLLLCGGMSSAQAQVCISGTVTDSSGAALPFVQVYLSGPDKTVMTGERGGFSICNLPKGEFILQAKLLGYRTWIARVAVQDSSAAVEIRMRPSTSTFPEVVVYGVNDSRPEETANDISTLSSAAMRESGALTLSEGIAKMPGVALLSTGNGISKPVIRGLFGNRIQTVLLGLRFDNQQWQDEHGLGLSDVGVDRVEVIKGPASLIYGNEAMGGVLNIIEEKPAPSGTTQSDVSMRAFSNTYGIATDAGVRSSKENRNWRIRAGMESHADYNDGDGRRILNSRFAGYFAKASLGFNKKRWVSRNDYLFSLSNFGFIMDPIQLSLPPDDRLSRSFEMPHHSVYLNLFSSQNTFYRDRSKIKLNLGFQSNNRQEQEGGSKISLNMLLNTFSGNFSWTRDLSEDAELSAGAGTSYQTNRNAGSRTIIPDANFLEASAFGYARQTKEHFAAEAGIRYDLKNIATFATGNINTDPFSPGTDILPFDRWYSSVNGSAGASLFDNKHWNVKANISTGFRPGNLAELSSNGLHEGTIRYEIGNIDLKVEQNLCADLSVGFECKWLSVSSSAYSNRFFNYIYLAPTSSEYLGFQIFRYLQKDALLHGIETVAELHPEKLKRVSLRSSFCAITGKTDDEEYLPFIPARKITAELKLRLLPLTGNQQFSIRAGGEYLFEQFEVDQFETPTGSYYLLNAGMNWELQKPKNNFTLGVSCNNLLNEAYYDHLSRFKYFGVQNMGRNISINCKISFN